jgi:hypothetical protein
MTVNAGEAGSPKGCCNVPSPPPPRSPQNLAINWYLVDVVVVIPAFDDKTEGVAISATQAERGVP